MGRTRRIGPTTRGTTSRLPVRLPGPLGIDAGERVREAVGVALAAHLAVGDDVDARAFHIADRQKRRVVLRLLEPELGHAPDLLRADARRKASAQQVAVDEPIGLRMAPDHRGRQD